MIKIATAPAIRLLDLLKRAAAALRLPRRTTAPTEGTLAEGLSSARLRDLGFGADATRGSLESAKASHRRHF